MRPFSLFVGMIIAVAVIGALWVSFGGNLAPTGRGAELYNPAKETTIEGTIEEVNEFSCPVNEGEIGTHVMVKTSNGMQEVHLAPARVVRAHKIVLPIGVKIHVVGAPFRFHGQDGLIARQITTPTEMFTLRDREGKLVVTQY